MNWSWTLPLRPTTKLILMSLSDMANDEGECFPSINYIAKRCCISPRHTRREIHKIISMDLMSTETRKRKDGSQTSNLYTLNIDKAVFDKLSPPKNRTKDTATSPDRETPQPSGDDEQTLPLTTIEPSIKPTTTTTTELAALKWPPELSSIDRSSIGKIVVGVPYEVAQQLLDELAGQLANIKRPVGYFHALLRKHQQGLFIPSSSTQVKTSRETKESNALALEHSTKLNIQRLRDYGIQIEFGDKTDAQEFDGEYIYDDNEDES